MRRDAGLLQEDVYETHWIDRHTEPLGDCGACAIVAPAVERTANEIGNENEYAQRMEDLASEGIAELEGAEREARSWAERLDGLAALDGPAELKAALEILAGEIEGKADAWKDYANEANGRTGR